MKRRDRRRQRHPAPIRVPVATTEQQLAACRAAALGLLKAGLTDDGRVGIETDRILKAGDNVAGAVLGFMTAHASNEYIRLHGNRENAIAAVTADLESAERTAQGTAW